MLDVSSYLEAAVCDQDLAPPAPRQAQPDDVGGRGLVLFEALADAWGVRAAPIGKWVWFRIKRRPGP